ncbi:MAG: hypothetical protein WC340_10985 [Kiritimatiellia bacterium]|jgi:hypothetical protein
MNPGGNPGTWNPIETRRYIWDGFNIAAEIIIDHSAAQMLEEMGEPAVEAIKKKG